MGWVAGSNSAAYVNAGEGWAAGAGAAEVLMLVAVGFGIVAFLGQLAYAATVIGTVTSGKAVPPGGFGLRARRRSRRGLR